MHHGVRCSNPTTDLEIHGRRTTSCWTLAAALVLLGAYLSTAAADTPALAVSGPNSFNVSSSTTFGWSFTLTATSTLVSQLGFFDYQGDGLNDAVVAIWTSAGALEATATVPAGTTAPLIAGFRYASLTTPVALPAGNYTIGGLVTGGSSDNFLADATTLNAASGVTYGAPRGVAGNSLTFPSGDIYNGSYTNGYFGPDFQIGVVPEPRSWMLLALGAGAFFVAQRRRSRPVNGRKDRLVRGR